jgi:hypothetical protein
MDEEHGGGGLELAWILWTCVAVLFLIFGVVELVSSRHTVSFWLVAGLVCVSCSIFALALSPRGSDAGDTLGRAMAEATGESGAPQDGELSDILDATLALSQTQLLAQIADETSLDGRTMGMLGFNGALVAADVAAKDVLGTWWWTPLPFVLLTALLCAKSILAKDTSLGPAALVFFSNYGGQSSKLAREQLLADLDVAYKSNSERAAEKAGNLRGALAVLAAGLVIAGSLIAFDRPSKVETHANPNPAATTTRTAAARTGSGTVGAAANRSARHHQIAPAKR